MGSIGSSIAIVPRHGTGAAWLAVIAIAIIACYSNSFSGVFLFDDATGIVENDSIRTLSPVTLFTPPAETTVSGRPVVNVTFGLNYAISGLDTWSYHGLNLLIHVLAAWALFGIVRRTLRMPRLADRFGRHADALAFAIALLWAIHPLQTESVTYLVQRAESLAGLVYLAVLYAFIRMLTTSRANRWGWIAVGLCAIGMLCKEIVATAPFVLLAFDSIVYSGERPIELLKRRRQWYLPLVATIAIAVIIVLVNPRGSSAGFGLEKLPTPLEYAASQPGVILHYLQLTFWPSSLCLDYDWPVATSQAAIAIPSSIVLGILLIVCAAAIRRYPASFLGIWFFAILLPTSSFIPIADLAFEHRMYLPLAAPIAIVVLCTYRLITSGERSTQTRRGPLELTAVCGVAVAVSLGIRTFDRNRDYASAEGMWADVITKRPLNARARFNRAHALYEQGHIDAAMAGYRDALRIAPNYARAQSKLGALLCRENRTEEALELLLKATTLAPNQATYHYNLGIALASLGRDADAEAAYNRCIELDAHNADAYYNLGNIALRRRDYDAAAAAYAKAIDVRPEHVRANYNLGGIYQVRGDPRRAAALFDRAFAAAMHEGENQRLKGRLVEAADAFQAATQVRPDSADAHYELACSLRDIGNFEAARFEATAAARLRPSMQSAARLLKELDIDRLEQRNP